MDFVPTAAADLGNPGDAAIWDTSIWDGVNWSGEQLSWNRWISLNNLGFAGAIFLKLAVVVETTWLTTDFKYITGGTI